MTLVIQSFKTLVVKELFSRHKLFFSLFSEMFSSVKPSLLRKLISRVSYRTDSKLELRLRIQYLNKDAVNVASESVLLAADVIEFATLGSLSNDDGDGNKNGKKKKV